MLSARGSADLKWSAHLQHPAVRHDDAGSRNASGKLVYPPELCVDATCHGAPAGVGGTRMGLQRPADGVVVPVTAGPVDDQRQAEEVQAQREQQEDPPAAAHLRGPPQLHQNHQNRTSAAAGSSPVSVK